MQGGFAAHAQSIAKLGHTAVLVREAQELSDIAGLVLPGGESTTQLKLIERYDLREALTQHWRSGKPILATCAGLILVAREVSDPEQPSLNWLDVRVQRNAWGRQLDSFEAEATLASGLASDAEPLPLVFIRAPRILAVGPSVETLVSYEGEPVLVRAGQLFGATFHPELTQDLRVHRWAFGEL